MTDYQELIDPETWAFIERTNAFYSPDAVQSSVAEQRATYDRMCREFFAGYPTGVTASNGAVREGTRSIPIRHYRKGAGAPAATILYFHGGGFVLGGLDSHDDVCAELTGRTGFECVSVDYRLSPEHVHPAAFEDALACFTWATQQTSRPIVLCGDSAGGNLAAAVSHAIRDKKGRSPVGQVLIYPGLGGDRTLPSYRIHSQAPMLTLADLDYYHAVRSGGGDHSSDPTFAPLADADFSGLPATVIITAQCDPLSSDGEAYRDRILAAGGKAWWHEEPGLVHGYLRARHMVARARESFSRVVEAVAALGEGRWPYGG